MSEHIIKVVFSAKDFDEKFYVKQQISDLNNSYFEPFKKKVLYRNPSFDAPSLKIYWIDDDKDEITMRFEEDFQMFLAQSHDKKVFFHITQDIKYESELKDKEKLSNDETVEPEELEKNVETSKEVLNDDMWSEDEAADQQIENGSFTCLLKVGSLETSYQSTMSETMKPKTPSNEKSPDILPPFAKKGKLGPEANAGLNSQRKKEQESLFKAPNPKLIRPLKSANQIMIISSDDEIEEQLSYEETRVEVEVLNIVSPAEFYISLKHHQEDFNALHISLQQQGNQKDAYRKLLNKPLKENYSVGEMCMVKTAITADDPAHWYRAIIKEKKSRNFKVFLVDKGIKTVVNLEQILKIPSCLFKLCHAAVKMKIAEELPAAVWSLSTIDCFKRVITSFKGIYVSIIGDKSEDESIPAIVWGVNYKEFKTGLKQKQFHNLSELLKNEGYIVDDSKMTQEELLALERKLSDCDFGWKSFYDDGSDKSESFSSSEDEEDVQVEQKADQTYKIGELVVDLNMQVIDSWLPSKLSFTEEFIGVATSVDKNAIIYIQSDKHREILRELNMKITSIYSHQEMDRYEKKLKLGQPVIVHNMLDATFYRARVVSFPRKKSNYKVMLVDYGSYEYVDRGQIYCNVVASNVPIQVQKYRLASLVPQDKANVQWPSEAIDLIHLKVVDKNVKVIVTGGMSDVLECSIYVLNEAFQQELNVEQLLLNKKFARPRESTDIWPPGNDQDEHQDYVIDILNPDDFTRYNADEENQNYQQKFKNFIENRIQESVQVLPPLSPTPAKLQRNPSVSSKNSSGNISSYDLKKAGIKMFQCKFESVLNFTKVYITPDIPELNQEITEMNKFLESIDDNYLIRFSHPQRSVGKLCLAKSDHGWQRGIVTKPCDNNRSVKVFLIDKAQIAEFKLDQISKMPMHLLNFPKKTLEVVLYGVVINKMLPNHEVVFPALVSSLKDKNLTAVILDFNTNGYPIVELFDEHGIFAYQSLIDKKYFVQML